MGPRRRRTVVRRTPTAPGTRRRSAARPMPRTRARPPRRTRNVLLRRTPTRRPRPTRIGPPRRTPTHPPRRTPARPPRRTPARPPRRTPTRPPRRTRTRPPRPTPPRNPRSCTPAPAGAQRTRMCTSLRRCARARPGMVGRPRPESRARTVRQVFSVAGQLCGRSPARPGNAVAPARERPGAGPAVMRTRERSARTGVPPCPSRPRPTTGATARC